MTSQPPILQPKRKSTITKAMEIKVFTGRYENVVFRSSTTEEIEWSTIQERIAKEEAIANYNVDMLKRNVEYGLSAFGLNRVSHSMDGQIIPPAPPVPFIFPGVKNG
jgi:hypothetical protein